MCTERLTLRPATEGDADATWKYRRLPSVGQWLSQLPTDLTSYRARFAEPQRLAATVMVEREGHVVGDLMLRIENASAQAEVAPDAKGAQAELANDKSWQLMERLGMRREGHAVSESLHRSGQWLDTVTYALLATEWRL
jgi:hypothetical protein